MRKNIYTETIDRIKAPDKTVGKALEAVKKSNKGEIVVMKYRRLKFTGMVAASLAIVIAGGIGAGTLLNHPKADITGSTSTSSVAEPKNVKSANSFIMTVNAAELTKDNAVLIDTDKGGGISFGISEDHVHYNIELPFECSGENIKTITYSVDQGAFSVSYYGNDPILSGIKSTHGFNIGTKYPPVHDQELINKMNNGEVDIKCDYYSSITLTPDHQKTDGAGIEWIGDSIYLSEEKNEYLKTHAYTDMGKGASLEDEQKCLDVLLGGTIINCTVEFEDGTVQSQDIRVSTTITTYGEFLKGREDADEYESIKDESDVFITYSLL